MATMTIQEAATLADLAKLILPLKEFLTEENIAAKIKGVEGAQEIISQKTAAQKTITAAQTALAESNKKAAEIEVRDKASTDLQTETSQKATQLIADRNAHQQKVDAFAETQSRTESLQKAAVDAKKAHDDKTAILDEKIAAQDTKNNQLDDAIADYKNKAESLVSHLKTVG